MKSCSSKNGVFVGKGYSCDGMFKLSCINIAITNNNIPSMYLLEWSFNLWHQRVGNVNYNSLNFMYKFGLISCNDKLKEKCKICIQAKND